MNERAQKEMQLNISAFLFFVCLFFIFSAGIVASESSGKV